ncbi:hypothetical protein DM02DRAFT_588817 [Periconia macrospinosa]|uniref:Rhodopsin domain-containing protein n=1 Tax=Periconia macrospinosa TaxID=97972 RepID=A0A2V1DY64_9PLEO|nr:hypothetical protein DM02DRAFT_588817 [Periconia macrospinosa]
MDSSQQNHAGQFDVYLTISFTFAAATISLILRIVARRLIKLTFCYDDAFVFIAYFFAAVWAGLLFYWLQNGLGLLLVDIDLPTEKALEISRFVHWSGEIVYASSLAFSRLSILGFYWRIFKNSSIKIPIQVLAFATALWLVLRTFLAVFHCVPIEKFWRPSLLGRCDINDNTLFVATAIIHLIFDLQILLLPVVEVSRLQLPKAQRVGIITMFGFGVFVCVSSIMVMIQSRKYDAKSPELPWITAPIFTWVTAEINFSLISACLPTLRPIYQLIIGRPLRTASCQAAPWPHSQPRPDPQKSGSPYDESVQRPYSSLAIDFSALSRTHPHRIHSQRLRPYSSRVPDVLPADPSPPKGDEEQFVSEKKDAIRISAHGEWTEKS